MKKKPWTSFQTESKGHQSLRTSKFFATRRLFGRNQVFLFRRSDSKSKKSAIEKTCKEAKNNDDDDCHNGYNNGNNCVNCDNDYNNNDDNDNDDDDSDHHHNNCNSNNNKHDNNGNSDDNFKSFFYLGTENLNFATKREICF